MILWRGKSAGSEKDDRAVQEARNVLVIRLTGLKEFVQTMAAAKVVRERHVGARITLLTTDEFKTLAETSPYFDVVEADGRPKDAQATAQLVARIRAAKYDLVYDFEMSKRTNNYYQGLRPWPPLWCGTAQGCALPVDDGAFPYMHPMDRLQAQLAAAGVGLHMPLVPDIRWVRAALRDPPRLQPDYFGIRGRYVVMTPRASDADSQKRWPEQKYIELCRRVLAQGATPVIVGDVATRALGASIASADNKIKNLVARMDLLQFTGLCEKAGHVVGDDVDYMHVAAAAGGSCIVLLSSNGDPMTAVPRGPGGAVALTAAVLADLPVDQVDRQLRNGGAYLQAGAA